MLTTGDIQTPTGFHRRSTVTNGRSVFGISEGSLLGPVFFDQTMTAERYVSDIHKGPIDDFLLYLSVDKATDVWFQQDSILTGSSDKALGPGWTSHFHSSGSDGLVRGRKLHIYRLSQPTLGQGVIMCRGTPRLHDQMHAGGYCMEQVTIFFVVCVNA